MVGMSELPSSGRLVPPGIACLAGIDLWVRREPDGSVTVGLTDEGQQRTGRIVHWRGPVLGAVHHHGDAVVSLESEKWVGHLPAPAGGTIVATHDALTADPSPINRDPYGEGWFYRIRPDGSVPGAGTGPAPSP